MRAAGTLNPATLRVAWSLRRLADANSVRVPRLPGGRKAKSQTEWPGSSLCVRPEGLEPPTPGSEDRCSIQLSYGRLATLCVAWSSASQNSWVYPFCRLVLLDGAFCSYEFRIRETSCETPLEDVSTLLASLSGAQTRQPLQRSCRLPWEERRDSNPRPPGPQPGALTSCATLPMYLHAREDSNLRPAA